MTTSTSMEMSAGARSRNESSHAELDQAIGALRDRAREFARLGPRARAALLRECLPLLAGAAGRWARTGARAKGLVVDTPAEGEEWLAGPLPTIRNVRLLARSLDDIAGEGKPRLPKPTAESRDGRAVVQVFPGEAIDGALFTGFRVDVRMLPEVSVAGVRDRQAPFYDKRDPEGGVSLVLGAGNVSSIAPMDALYKMFVEGHVCLVKMNPVNDYLGPLYEETLKPLVDRGFLRFAYGGADAGGYLSGHAGIDDLHITGSDRTHDLIVWGPPGPERDRRKAANDPLLKKPISSELGCVTPVILVPGEFSDGELDFLAQNLATMVANNASCNCNAAKMLITSKAWPQREALLGRVRDILAGLPPRKAYYPGAFDRYQRLVGGRDRAERLGRAGEGELPWTLVLGLDSKDKQEPLFTVEPFCPILSETTLDERDPAAFLQAATEFANERLWGTLSAVVILHPKTEKDPVVAATLERSIADLRYGAVGINHWTGLVYGLVTPPWGAHPSSTLQNIQGGLGWVHNTFMLDGIEKAVLRGPLTMMPKPAWFVTNRKSHAIAEKMVSMEAEPSWLKVPGIAMTALGG